MKTSLTNAWNESCQYETNDIYVNPDDAYVTELAWSMLAFINKKNLAAGLSVSSVRYIIR